MPTINVNIIAAYKRVLNDADAKRLSEISLILQPIDAILPKKGDEELKDDAALTAALNTALTKLAKITAPPAIATQAVLLSHALKVIGYSAELKLNYGFSDEKAPLGYKLYDYLSNERGVLTPAPLSGASGPYTTTLPSILMDAKRLCLQLPDEKELIAEVKKRTLGKDAGTEVMVVMYGLIGLIKSPKETGKEKLVEIHNTIQRLVTDAQDLALRSHLSGKVSSSSRSLSPEAAASTAASPAAKAVQAGAGSDSSGVAAAGQWLYKTFCEKLLTPVAAKPAMQAAPQTNGAEAPVIAQFTNAAPPPVALSAAGAGDHHFTEVSLEERTTAAPVQHTEVVAEAAPSLAAAAPTTIAPADAAPLPSAIPAGISAAILTHTAPTAVIVTNSLNTADPKTAMGIEPGEEATHAMKK